MHDLMSDAHQQSGPAEAADIGAVVADCFRASAIEQDRPLLPLSDDTLLLDSGLDSLCFAIIVAQLEDRLGVDPFSELDDAFFPVTFGDFVRLYEGSVEKAA